MNKVKFDPVSANLIGRQPASTIAIFNGIIEPTAPENNHSPINLSKYALVVFLFVCQLTNCRAGLFGQLKDAFGGAKPAPTPSYNYEDNSSTATQLNLEGLWSIKEESLSADGVT